MCLYVHACVLFLIMYSVCILRFSQSQLGHFSQNEIGHKWQVETGKPRAGGLQTFTLSMRKLYFLIHASSVGFCSVLHTLSVLSLTGF